MMVRIPTTVEAQAAYQIDSGDWSLRLHRRWGIQQAWVGWQCGPGPTALRWQASVETRLGAVGLGLAWSWR
jgi:hypothetical protein